MGKLSTKATIHIETMFENRPIELEFVRAAIKEKMERLSTEKGHGCPANNKECIYLWDDLCIHLAPKLKQEEAGRVSCGSYKLL